MKRLLLLATLACGTLPHPVERGIGYDYDVCTGKELQGSPVEVACRAGAEKKCEAAEHHKNCWVDYAYEARSR